MPIKLVKDFNIIYCQKEIVGLFSRKILVCLNIVRGNVSSFILVMFIKSSLVKSISS